MDFLILMLFVIATPAVAAFLAWLPPSHMWG